LASICKFGMGGGDMTSIRDQIIEIICVASRPRKPDLSDENKSLFEVGLDSLDYASTIMEVEEKYNLQIVEDDMDKLVSLKDLVTFVEARVAKP
jgi:acyl carrier protein